VHGRASRARSDVQFATKLLHSCAHAGDADTQSDRPAGPTPVRPVNAAVAAIVEATAVVADHQMRLLAEASQIDRDACRRRVAMHVGERLLHDAQERTLQRQG